jgi:hypothetical protein
LVGKILALSSWPLGCASNGKDNRRAEQADKGQTEELRANG